ncbi:MAG: FAD-dependent oxidoreductase, partial [Planctomycetales bacterium]|nr:FAD-dependent oxidoreductase [Planctomycetales bacterium]
VAGGASAAARIRRLDESAEIVMFERGPEPSFANCGLPYYIGGVIEQRDKLLVARKSLLEGRHQIDVRTHSDVVSIDRASQEVAVLNLETGDTYREAYDRLILAPGAAPLRPPIPGIDLPHIYTLRDLRDADTLHAITHGSNSAIVVGAGFIGVEVAENLIHRGLDVTMVELAQQVLAPWDAEMVAPIEEQLRARGVQLVLGTSATQFVATDDGITVQLSNGKSIAANYVVLAIGVRPENKLAAEAGLECGTRGGIITNDHMQTSDPLIYAVGDAIEVREYVSGKPTQIPLAGPANRQGRIAADHIFGRTSKFRGTQGTAVVGVFGMTAATTGLSEKLLRAHNIPYEKVYIHPANHAGYYPGAKQLSLKLLFSPADGKILGAQAVGHEGVDKRIDVLSVALQAGMTVYDLEEMELCYAPQFGSAKDPVNMAGFVASGVLRGDHPVAHSTDLDELRAGGPILLDVRTEAEWNAGHIPGAIHVPVDELRHRLDELSIDADVIVYCRVGMRGYLATRVLLHHGYRVKNLSGGIMTWERVETANRNTVES